jgi:geranylgeranyl pyrophosphate synthase
MAFQIIDDLLSYEGDGAVVGKPLQSDQRNHRVTLPIIYACRAGKGDARRRIRDLLLRDGDLAPEAAHAQLVALLRETRALLRARTLAYRYTATAKQHLDLLPYSEARERLRALADAFLARGR